LAGIRRLREGPCRLVPIDISRGCRTPWCGSRFHGFPDAFGSDRDGIADFFRALVAAAPDARIEADDLIADGDRVAVRFTLTGTHQNELLGAPGSGRPLNVEGITVLRFENGLVAERWNRLDDITLLTQLGLLPAAQTTA